MNLYVKINYPNVESHGDLLTVEKCTKEGDMSLDEILELYRQFERQGYRVSTKIDTKDLMIDPFEFANNLERAGINYTSTLNIKDKGTYDMIHPVASIIENYGFDYDVAILLKINDESQGLYESLANTNVTSEIIVTPKSPKVEDEVASILSLCQEGTVVKFTLKDAE